jgi:hypothetical protein
MEASVKYEVIVSSVHDRGDLLERTLCSMMAQLDARPERVIVHEDVRASQPFVPGRTEAIVKKLLLEFGVPFDLMRTHPGGGLARGLVRLLDAARTEFVFYSQEDFDFVRPVPVARALEIMSEHSLNQIRFNKRKTMRIKGEDRPAREQWKKVEVTIGGQVFCISDRWYHQASLWRRELALDGYRKLVESARPGKIVERCEDKFDHWINQTVGGGTSSVDGCQDTRHDKCRTFIWGRVGEPAFVKHTGGERRSQGWG